MRSNIWRIFDYLSPVGGRLEVPPEAAQVFGRAQAGIQMEELEQLVQEALSLTRSQSSGAYGTTLLKSGLLMEQRGFIERAEVYLRLAVKNGKDLDDLGALHWILGQIQYQIKLNKSAFRNWARATDIFTIERKVKEGQAEDVLVTHYADRLQWMYDERFCTLEEAYYTYLTYFSGRPTGLYFERLANNLMDLLEDRQYEQAHRLIDRLDAYIHEIHRREEQTLIHVRIGMALWQMGSVYQAVDRFQEAIARYLGTSRHQEAMARWMLGIIQWQVPEMERDAGVEWELACEAFHELEYESDRENLQERKLWYQQTGTQMRRLLEQRLEGASLS